MKFAVLVAGGTGGHINAALALGTSLEKKGYQILYLTGKRPLDYKLFKGMNTRHLDSKPLRTNNPVTLVKNIVLNFISFVSIFFIYITKRPEFIVGAGGYVCGPTLLAGFLQNIPVFIIEQNAVMGLTNKILGWISARIFVHFSKTKGLSQILVKKVRVVGNPTRNEIQPVPHKKIEGNLKVLVFGGSLGATQINKIIYDILNDSPLANLSIHHQIGSGQTAPSNKGSVDYLSMEYIENIQKEYEWCDVIIARAGASTVSELAIIKKPVLIFPYPQATDNHQFYNAEILKEESDFTVEIIESKTPHEECVTRAKDFLVKASKEALKYSEVSHSGNDTCTEVLREIQDYVGTP
jgi:UDP-N-acetylglucosamine--N-acetylmuramyl-(pentapeptide) pyrophosphoryl-undecaprenol N-acetylglucosamine transferase